MERLHDFLSFSRVINEKVVMPEDFKEFMNEIRDECIARPVSIREANRMGNPHAINFMNYPTFINSLPDDIKDTAPPANVPMFGFFGDDESINIVLNIPFIGVRDLGYLNHIIEHESVHRGQLRRRGNEIKRIVPDPKNGKEYFSDKDEIMAFSQSIVEMILRGPRPIEKIEDLKASLRMNPLWNTIRNIVDPVVQKRYLKYIYEYATNYLSTDNEVH